MTLPSDAAVSRGDIMRRLADLERAVSLLAAARSLEASQVGAGGVTVTGGDVIISGQGGLMVMHSNGQVFLEITEAETGFGPVERFTLYRRDGTMFYRAESNLFDFDFSAFLDRVGNFIILDDAAGGQGLGLPYLLHQFVSAATPTDSTASGTFTTLQKVVWLKQHPKFAAWVQHNVTATTGEIRWRINTGPDAGTIIGGPATIAGASQAFYGPFVIPGLHLSEFELELQGRVASGAGITAARTLSAYGRQS